MKRLIILLALILVSLSSAAQHQKGNVSAGYIRKKVTIYEKQKEPLQKFDAKTGLTHIAEFHPKILSSDKSHISFSYIAGYRFSNWFLAGVGTGLDFATEVNKGMRKRIKNNDETYYTTDYTPEYIDGSANAISIPLYAHAKVYYMQTRWAPYSSVSLGGRFAPRDSGVYFDISTGVNYLPPQTFTDKYKITGIFAAIGFVTSNMQDESVHDSDWYSNQCGDNRCPYFNSKTSHYHYETHFYNGASIGLSLRLGVTF